MKKNKRRGLAVIPGTTNETEVIVGLDRSQHQGGLEVYA